MHIFRKTAATRKSIVWRSIIILPALLVAFVFIYGIMVVLGGLIPVNRNRSVLSEGEQIYLLNNGYHIALALPRDNCPYADIFDIPLNLSGQGGYFYFGWGDRQFYLGTPTVKNIDLPMTARALFTPTPAVLEILYFPKISASSPGISILYVSKKELSDLYKYIKEYFMKPGEKPMRIPQDGIDQAFKGSIFFAAHGTYSLFKTCNNWTSQALKKAGIGTHLWTPFTWGVE